MGEVSVSLYTRRGCPMFVSGAIRLDCCFNYRRCGSCDVDCFADGSKQFLSQLLDGGSSCSFNGCCTFERIACFLLRNRSSCFGVQSRSALHFGAIFRFCSTVLSFLCPAT